MEWLGKYAAVLGLAVAVFAFIAAAVGIGFYQIESIRAELRADRAAASANAREIRTSVLGLIGAVHANDKRIDKLEQARR